MSDEVISIYQITGDAGSPVFTEQSAIRFCADDLPTPGLEKPAKVPPVGVEEYDSYWITICLYYSGSFSLITNMRMWSQGNIKTLWFSTDKGRMVTGRLDDSSGGHGFLVSSYQRSTGTSGLTGHKIKDGSNGHLVYKGQTLSVVDVDTLTESAPLVIDTRNITAEGYSKAFLLQTEQYPGAIHDEMTPVDIIIAVDVV